MQLSVHCSCTSRLELQVRLMSHREGFKIHAAKCKSNTAKEAKTTFEAASYESNAAQEAETTGVLLAVTVIVGQRLADTDISAVPL